MSLNELNKIKVSSDNTGKMPALFIGHGSPMNAIEENEFVHGWKEVAKNIPKPSAILCISAHWETKGTFVTAMERPKTIHDFGGFPRELFEIEYPAPGSPSLASETKTLITGAEVGLDYTWGLDHGCWSVIRNLYPAADIPVFQMSLDFYRSPKKHYELAKELEDLRHRGILILGSGNMVHNLRMVAWDKLNEDFSYDWALEAREKLNDYLLNGKNENLINIKSEGKAFELAIPTPEHYLPMLYILGVKKENERLTLFNDKTLGGSLSMTSFIVD